MMAYLSDEQKRSPAAVVVSMRDDGIGSTEELPPTSQQRPNNNSNNTNRHLVDMVIPFALWLTCAPPFSSTNAMLSRCVPSRTWVANSFTCRLIATSIEAWMNITFVIRHISLIPPCTSISTALTRFTLPCSTAFYVC